MVLQWRSVVNMQIYSVSVNWTSLFVGGNANVPFSNQHWNSFVDLTGDCFPDLVITNSQSI